MIGLDTYLCVFDESPKGYFNYYDFVGRYRCATTDRWLSIHVKKDTYIDIYIYEDIYRNDIHTREKKRIKEIHVYVVFFDTCGGVKRSYIYTQHKLTQPNGGGYIRYTFR